MIVLEHRGPAEIRLGVIHAQNILTSSNHGDFESRLEQLLVRRQAELDPTEDEWRKSVRDMLRHGRFKPTGRGKPASEYLLGAARKGFFPRINSVVDICNYISLSYLLPVSVWDAELAGVNQFLIRLGTAEESYIFNQGGQYIDLDGLVVGCAIENSGVTDSDGTPIVSPVKDSHATKTHDDSANIAAIIYAPRNSGPAPDEILSNATHEFEQLISRCGTGVMASSGILDPGAILEV